MLPAGIASFTRIQTLHCDPYRLIGGIETLFNELLLISQHGIRRAVFYYYGYRTDFIGVFFKVACPFQNLFYYYNSIGNCDLVSIFQLLSNCGYAQLKHLPRETEFWRIHRGYLDLSSDPLLKHIGTTAEDGSENYELLEQEAGRFGSMKISLKLKCSRSLWPLHPAAHDTVAIRIIDNGLKNASRHLNLKQ
jgi:hypothetical protein